MKIKSKSTIMLFTLSASISPYLASAEIMPEPASDADTALKLEEEFVAAPPSAYQVESSLEPEDVFHRVPLSPPMSESNWKKYAGPMIEKNYNIRKGDTLWSISDKLFGTPYLWPKVWQLNAMFGNAHQIEPGISLRFNPGNPHAAPAFAVDQAKQAEFAYGMVDTSFAPPTLLERLEATLAAQSDGKIPPFRSFLLTDRLPSVGSIPGRKDEKSLYEAGETFDTEISDGTYSIIRWEKFRNVSGYRVFWNGVVNVLDGKALISKAFTEIRKGDLITPRLFLLSPMAVHEETVGEEKREDLQIIPVEEGYRSTAGNYMTLGVRYKFDDAGPQPGALVNLMRLGKVMGKAMLIDRDRRSGTMWVIEADTEITDQFTIE